MMQEDLGVVEVRLAGNRAHAEAADVFDAALLDEVRDHVNGLVEVVAVFSFEIGDGSEEAAPGADLAGDAREPLLGAEVQVQAAARVELRSDLREAGAFGGRWGCRDGLRGCGRRRILLPATGNGDEAEQGGGGRSAAGVEALHNGVWLVESEFA